MPNQTWKIIDRTELVEALSPDRTQGQVLIADRRVCELHPWLLEAAAERHTGVLLLDAVETRKTLATCADVWDFLAAQRIDRRSRVIIVGGGWTLDLVAFASSVWKRGLTFDFLPTTLLAQADACLGGKCGVNYRGAKNQLGAFAPARLVWVWPGFLETLPPRELRAGWAEVVKHALIADADYWEELTALNWPPADWVPILERSLRIKGAIVAQDPREEGLREVLNFGHTLGHALESASLTTETPLLHGEAIWYGMWAESLISESAAGLDPAAGRTIRHYITSQDFLVNLPAIDVDSLLDWVRQDKKNMGMRTRLSLLTAIGSAKPGYIVSDDVLTSSMRQALCP
jgi:3-dehydroquinate synthase